ncbi:MAG: ORF6N domain-containing protein [Thermoanaerobaculia bacterium]
MPVDVETRIRSLRGVQVLLDSDLAAIYGVSTKAFNQAVKRSGDRFPGDFAFQLSGEEFDRLRSQIVTSKAGRGGRRYLPWAFTEHGAMMAATVLNSPRAVEMSIFIVRVVAHDADLTQVFAALRRLLEPPEVPRPRIGFKAGFKAGLKPTRER